MASFFPHTRHGYNGFDIGATPRWQMVPFNGDRWVWLLHGAGLAVNKTSSVITLREIPPADLPDGPADPPSPGDRAFHIHGMRPGLTKIRATDNGALVTELEVNVLEPKIVTVSYHFVRDSASPPHHTTRVPASAQQWTGRMNWIFKLQANVEVRTRLTDSITVPGDLGPSIRTVARPVSRTDDWNRVVAQRDDGAHFNVYLVWVLDAVDNPANEAAMASIDCLWEDNTGPQEGETLAHELGHHLGLSDHYVFNRRNELMYGFANEHGTFLPRADALTANRRA